MGERRSKVRAHQWATGEDPGVRGQGGMRMGGEETSTLGGNGVRQKWGEEGGGTKGKKSVGREREVERKEREREEEGELERKRTGDRGRRMGARRKGK